MRQKSKNLILKGSPKGRFKYKLRHGPVSPISILNNDTEFKMFETLTKDVKGLKNPRNSHFKNNTIDLQSLKHEN